MRSLSPCVAVVLGLVFVTGLSGCHVAQPSALTSPSPSAAALPDAGHLWNQTVKSMAEATSARIAGSETSASVVTTIDIAGSADGSNSRAVVSQWPWSVEILTVDDNQYVKGDLAYWRRAGLSDAAIATIGSRYVKKSKDFERTLSIGQMLYEFQQAYGTIGSLLKTERADLAGVPTYLLSYGTLTWKAWVTQDASPLLLKLSTRGGEDLTFSEWNAVKPFSAPPADQVAEI